MTNNSNSTPSSGSESFLRFFRAFAVLMLLGLITYFVHSNVVNEDAKYPFKFGLDIAGGAHLVYEADVSKIDPLEVPALMDTLRILIEKRINTFGVSEPIVYVESSSFVTAEQHQRLIVELPGVTDVDKAIAEIGRTPLLEFKLLDKNAAATQAAVASTSVSLSASSSDDINAQLQAALSGMSNPYIDTGLTGRYLASAQLQFSGGNTGKLANDPVVAIKFTPEGAELFANITRDNVGEQLAIFLDGEMISAPNINEAIIGGTAIISGGFNAQEAKDLAQNLSLGALPVPVELQSTQTIGGALGEEALNAGVYAGVLGFVLLSIFMILWYRLPGLVSVVALFIYVMIMLVLFQLIPVVITAAGIAGLILSVGLAVDANVLIAERIKEELIAGKDVKHAISEGFARAWLAIRDSNIAHIISAVVLFWFGTSLIKGFALVFGIGVAVSMLSAITISRTFLVALPIKTDTKIGRFLMGSGFFK